MTTVFCVYLCIHFLAYALWVRKAAYFKQETHIFLFHALPAAAVTTTAAAVWLFGLSQGSFAAFVFIVSLQGIYSISFLELWSLAQGGYSISILAEVARAESSGDAPDLTTLGRIGTDKQRGRLDGLAKLGLLSLAEDGRHQLTPRGRLVATAIAAIRGMANLREMG